MTAVERPRILFIDAYDSFSNNIISLLETSLNAEVTVIRIDTPVEDFSNILKIYAAVIAGPGPGDPRIAKDVGLFRKLWKLDESDLIPVLGICLGFQSLVLAHRGRIERLPEPRHGMVRTIRSHGQSIFKDISLLETVQYHSLYAILDSSQPVETAKAGGERADVSQSSSDMISLAWDLDMDNKAKEQRHVSAQNPISILMAVKHRKKPFCGIQFHPESISSSPEARKVIKNWWIEVENWWKGRRVAFNGNASLQNVHEKIGRSPNRNMANFDRMPLGSKMQRRVISTTVELADLTIPMICEVVGVPQGDAIVFDSENHQRSETGAFSIVGIIEHESLRFEYGVGSSEVRQICSNKATTVSLEKRNGDVFTFLKKFMGSHQARHDQHGIPFWGGLMGYISYEACLETLETRELVQTDRVPRRPDLSFVFVERSIVIDHFRRIVHIQSIKPSDEHWVHSTSSLLSSSPLSVNYPSLPKQLNATISFPDEGEYKSKIRACQESIRAGNSYELCLTTQSTITAPSRLPSWPLYCRLREMNPAPFGAYICLGDLSILSSSPERFMRWSRPSADTLTAVNDPNLCTAKMSTLQFRPIKGTVARRPTSASQPRSLFEATRLLSTEKERAENLMIVDLIRHDLHGVVGSGSVDVPKLMVVEEYETVFQLVTVVEGRMRVDSPCQDLQKDGDLDRQSNGGHCHVENKFEGLMVNNSCGHRKDDDPADEGGNTQESLPNLSRPKLLSPMSALPATLPPGSMTGAPKLRSCQILGALESCPRGVYSGVIGYMDVGGGGDWSVAIRCAVRWKDPKNSVGDTWTVGAGGAVTALSTEEGEWAEMLAKLQATLRVFSD